MKQISGYIPDELHAAISEMAERENRKLAPMMTILLQVGLKEKTRKRDGKRKSNSKSNASNMVSSDGQ